MSDTEQHTGNNSNGQINILTYKIALPTDDGQFIAGHFGRASAFLVAEIQGKKIISRDLRPNDSHEAFPKHEHSHHEHDPQQQSSAHGRIADILFDVDIILVNRIGPRAYDDLVSKGFTVLTTDIARIEDAINYYLSGRLKQN